MRKLTAILFQASAIMLGACALVAVNQFWFSEATSAALVLMAGVLSIRKINRIPTKKNTI
jgi:hypothetical protein